MHRQTQLCPPHAPGPTRLLALMLLFMVMVSFWACGRGDDLRRQQSQAHKIAAMTNRATVPEPYVTVLVTLKEPPLLAKAQRTDDGKRRRLRVDPKHRRSLMAEQSHFLAKLPGLTQDYRLLFRYRLTANGFALQIPRPLLTQLAHATDAASVQECTRTSPARLSTPQALQNLEPASQAKVWDLIAAGGALSERGLDGRGVRIGVIDTGIDYTHAAFQGGPYQPEPLYQRLDPSHPAPALPLHKGGRVVGGIDLVGTHYSNSARAWQERLPRGDSNPLDESGHGTHVASIISQLAPAAQLYAIKAFGRHGGTADHVLLAAFEYAADPNGDGEPDDHLDLINLSLGVPFGWADGILADALALLAKADVLAVMSAGNSGPIRYSVGSPGASPHALSVAATTTTRPPTISASSAWGPRSIDTGFKPQIAAPGERILGAQIGSGRAQIALSGTSVAAPFVSAALALLRQSRPHLSGAALQNLLLAHSLTLHGGAPAARNPLPIAAQGTGLLQITPALRAPLIISPAALSLGALNLTKPTTLTRVVDLYNDSGDELRVKLTPSHNPAMEVGAPDAISLAPHTHLQLPLPITLSPAAGGAEEQDSFVSFVDEQGQGLGKLSILAVLRPTSRVKASLQTRPGRAGPTLRLRNLSAYSGLAYPFNLLHSVPLPADGATAGLPRESKLCQIASVAYRILPTTVQGGLELQLAVAMQQSLTNWHHCEVSAQFLPAAHQPALQELLGTDRVTLIPHKPRGEFASILTDAEAMRAARARFDSGLGSDDYGAAILHEEALIAFPHSSLVIVAAPLSKLAKGNDGQLHVQITSLIASRYHKGRAEFRIAHELTTDLTIPSEATAQSFRQLPPLVRVLPYSWAESPLERGRGQGPLVVYFPDNRPASEAGRPGKQAQIFGSEVTGEAY